jgi:hypothetical protein
MNVAIVTPYYDEPLDVLLRCRDSVAAQNHGAVHYFVADGRPRPEIDHWPIRHIKLPAGHADGGATPRGLGAICAFNAGFEAVGFLDADNWLRADHVSSCVKLCRSSGADVVFADRQIVLSTGELCPFEDRDIIQRRHVDTSGFFLTARAAHLAPLWTLLGKDLWPACDRLMFATLRARGVSHAWTGLRSVFYCSRWGLHFKALGLPPPSDEHHIDWKAVRAAWDPADFERRSGVWLDLNLGEEHAEAAGETCAEAFLNRLSPLPPEQTFSALPRRFTRDEVVS